MRFTSEISRNEELLHALFYIFFHEVSMSLLKCKTVCNSLSSVIETKRGTTCLTNSESPAVGPSNLHFSKFPADLIYCHPSFRYPQRLCHIHIALVLLFTQVVVD